MHPTRLDRLIAWLSPQRGARRLVARARIEIAPQLLARYYEAARPWDLWLARGVQLGQH